MTFQAPRISPLPPAQWDPETANVLRGAVTAPDGGTLNLFSTLAHHPKLLKKWLVFASHLLVKGELPPRERELLILRTAWNCGCEYEWGQHVLLGRRAGLGEAEIVRVVDGPDAPGWSVPDATLLRAADELHKHSRIGARTWSALGTFATPQQLIELPFLVGHYHMVAFTLRSLAVAREPGVPSWPDARTPPAAQISEEE